MKRPFLFLLCCSSLVFVASCSKLGYGVVLWPPQDGSWVPGNIVTVKDESMLRQTYIVNQEGNSKLKEEIDTWRVKLFNSQSEATDWANNLGEWTNKYAMVTFQGLPMRSEPSNLSDQLYRFREGERLKILGRQQEPVTISRLEGYWYRVMAKGGIEGYVFDYYLTLIDVNNGVETVLNAKTEQDSTLDNFLSSPWRPSWYRQMVNSGQINLSTFSDAYGLFTDREAQTIRLSLPDLEINEVWESIVPLAENRYEFTGTNLRVTIQSPFSMRLEYNDGSTDKISSFVRLENNLSFYRKAELDRRNYIRTALVEAGPTFSSRRYGRLTFNDDGTFRWIGKILLTSRKEFSSRMGNTGTLELNMFPDSSIAGFHDGVLVFKFSSGTTIRFLYTFENSGLNLLFVPERAVKDNRVLTDQFIDPLQLEFLPLGSG